MIGVVPSNSSYLPVEKAENAPEASALDVEAGKPGLIISELKSRESSHSSIAVGGRERAVTYSPAAPENTPTVLTFTNIMVCTKTKPKKVLLNNLSGAITGGFWAIMGACGSGKTLLLSTLSLRLDQNILEVKGDIRMNGREFSRHTLKAMSAYVMQEDLLHAELTVEETLTYAARLRMARNTTTEEREGRIAEILNILGIPHTRSTIIGNTVRKGISGGERKRVSIAVELLNYPKLVFLDEPTTGLDSTTSLSVCDALKKLTQKGDCTVICTIHQPQPKIFDLFDNLILLKQGNMVYHGSARKTDRFLNELGMPCPAGLAIADHLIDIISPTDGDVDVVTDTARKYVVPVDLSLGIEKKFFDFDLSKNTWSEQFVILFQRNMQQYLRNSDVIVMNLLVTALLAIFIGAGLWHNIGTGQDSIAKRVPSLFFCCVTQGIICSLQAINSFPVERAIMLRERQAGSYRVSAYFMAKSAVDVLAAFWPPIIFSCIVYFMIGYQKRADKFFMFMFFMVLNSLAPSSAATAISCFCGTIDISLVVLSVTLEGCRLFGGFFASPKQFDAIPKWRFADVLSYMKYSFIGVALNELSGLELDCDKAHCAVTSGQQIIDTNGYDEYSTGYCIGILFVLIVGSRLLAYLGLRFIKS